MVGVMAHRSGRGVLRFLSRRSTVRGAKPTKDEGAMASTKDIRDAKANELERADDIALAYQHAAQAVKKGMDRRTAAFGLAGHLGFAVPTNGNAPAAVNGRGA